MFICIDCQTQTPDHKILVEVYGSTVIGHICPECGSKDVKQTEKVEA